jgi:hypothetical protein
MNISECVGTEPIQQCSVMSFTNRLNAIVISGVRGDIEKKIL